MTDKQSGSEYVSEVDYPAGFYANQAPVHLSYVSALNGVRGPDPSADYRYCELGAGAGKTLAVLAAANPDAEFVGIDINPIHVEAAQAMAAAGGVENAKFVTADVAGPDMDALPEFDFITMHGLYGWVSAEVRQGIRRFIGAKLRPGGLVYVTYNTLPGWGGAGQMRRYFQDRAGQLDGELTAKVTLILDELDTLRRENAPFFQANPGAVEVLERMRSADPRYVIHEFLGPDWQTLLFADVQAEMAEVGLEFAADAQIEENLLEHLMPAALAEHVRRREDRVSQQMAKDFIGNRFFRSDVYVRPKEGDGSAKGAPVLDVLLGLEKTPLELPDTVELSDRELSLPGDRAGKLKQLLAFEARSVAEIRALPEFSAGDAEDMPDIAKLMTAGRRLLPFARRGVPEAAAPAGPIRICPPLNRKLVDAVDHPGSSVILASPAAGTGIGITALEACLLLALEAGDPIAAAAEQFSRRGLQLRDGSRIITELAETRAAIEQILPTFVSGKLPKLVSLGVVEAAGS